MGKLSDLLFAGQKQAAKSLVRWKLQKEGKPLPDEKTLDQICTSTVDEANKILKKRGRNIWEEAKHAAREFKEGKSSD